MVGQTLIAVSSTQAGRAVPRVHLITAIGSIADFSPQQCIEYSKGHSPVAHLVTTDRIRKVTYQILARRSGSRHIRLPGLMSKAV